MYNKKFTECLSHIWDIVNYLHMTIDKVANRSLADSRESIFRYSIIHSCSLVILFQMFLYIIRVALIEVLLEFSRLVVTIATLYLHS